MRQRRRCCDCASNTPLFSENGGKMAEKSGGSESFRGVLAVIDRSRSMSGWRGCSKERSRSLAVVGVLG